jgi:hypothetical protein
MELYSGSNGRSTEVDIDQSIPDIDQFDRLIRWIPTILDLARWINTDYCIRRFDWYWSELADTS